MSEMTIGTLAVASMGICVIDSFLWMWGGRSGKYKRRYIGSAIQTIGINILSVLMGVWVWQFAASIVPEIISRCKGYGGDTVMGKVIRRSVFALFSLSTGVMLAWAAGFSNGALTLLGIQALVSVASIVLGVTNPIHAAAEEVFVCITLKYFNYGYIFIL